jgi:hypothetical protein
MRSGISCVKSCPLARSIADDSITVKYECSRSVSVLNVVFSKFGEVITLCAIKCFLEAIIRDNRAWV